MLVIVRLPFILGVFLWLLLFSFIAQLVYSSSLSPSSLLSFFLLCLTIIVQPFILVFVLPHCFSHYSFLSLAKYLKQIPITFIQRALNKSMQFLGARALLWLLGFWWIETRNFNISRQKYFYLFNYILNLIFLVGGMRTLGHRVPGSIVET